METELRPYGVPTEAFSKDLSLGSIPVASGSWPTCTYGKEGVQPPGMPLSPPCQPFTSLPRDPYSWIPCHVLVLRLVFTCLTGQGCWPWHGKSCVHSSSTPFKKWGPCSQLYQVLWSRENVEKQEEFFLTPWENFIHDKCMEELEHQNQSVSKSYS